MKTSSINSILNSQPILIKFALKLSVCKCLSFQTHLFLDLRFPLICYTRYLICILFTLIILGVSVLGFFSIRVENSVST